MRQLTTVIGAFILFATQVQADFMPENNLHLQDSFEQINSLTEAEFNAVIEQQVKLFEPVVASFGAKLTVNRLWTNATVNANASQSGTAWSVNMYGGLARRAEVTADGFAMVLCHEIGHHLGGFPFVSAWAANDGQSDYFATKVCPNLIWADDVDGNAKARATVEAIPKAKCDEVYSTVSGQDICYRAMSAGKSLANLLAALGGTAASWETPDTRVVTKTDDAHPAAQCRLDTYAAGALCIQATDQTVIPGKARGSARNTLPAEEDSALNYCVARDSYVKGLRPACWYKSRI